MRRLLEAPPADDAEKLLAELLRQAKPARVNPFRKRQIRVRLSTPRRGRTLHLGHLRWVAALLLFGAGSAAAAIGLGWSPVSVSTKEETQAAPANDTLTERNTAAAHQKLPAQALRQEEDPPRHPPSDLPAPEEPGAAPAIPPPASPATSPLSKPGADAPTRSKELSAKGGEDPSPVMEAISAWRSERNGSRARALLGSYLREHPRGALAEDALALLIEIAAAQNDPKAVAYARRYLSSHPQGRFRALAERVAGTSS